MGLLADQREALALDLAETGMRVFAAWPERLDAPCIALDPGEPWLDDVATAFGEWNAHLSVHVIAGPGNAEDELLVLEEALESVLNHVGDWGVISVGYPVSIKVSGAVYLATVIELTKPFKLSD